MVLTVAMGKGGTAKSTTVAALASLSNEEGKKVLCIDIDPQGNLTAATNGNKELPGTLELLTRKGKPEKLIQRTAFCDLISAGTNLSDAVAAIQNKPGRDNILRAAIAPLVPKYDLILIDTPPYLNTLLVNALAASDRVLLPMQANLFCFMGLQQTCEIIEQIKEYCNPAIEIMGIVFTRHNPRSALSKDLVPEIKEYARPLGIRVFDTYIRQAASVEQSQVMRTSLFDYAPRSTAADDYRKLYEEMKGSL